MPGAEHHVAGRLGRIVGLGHALVAQIFERVPQLVRHRPGAVALPGPSGGFGQVDHQSAGDLSRRDAEGQLTAGLAGGQQAGRQRSIRQVQQGHAHPLQGVLVGAADMHPDDSMLEVVVEREEVAIKRPVQGAAQAIGLGQGVAGVAVVGLLLDDALTLTHGHAEAVDIRQALAGHLAGHGLLAHADHRRCAAGGQVAEFFAVTGSAMGQ